MELPNDVTIGKAFSAHTGGTLTYPGQGEAGLIILVGNKGGGWEPFACRLPHQVYEKDLERVFADRHFEMIAAFPVDPSSVIPIAYRGEYEKQRWTACACPAPSEADNDKESK
jgi:hypothetical protein